MTLSNTSKETTSQLIRTAFRLPLVVYKLGWAPLFDWVPLLVLTTQGRKSGNPRHVVIEYRRHGSKYYVVSGWGENTDWFKNISENPRVTIQHGGHIYDACAYQVDNTAEALRALYMFSRNSWIYETLFARMSSAQSADLSTLAEVVGEFTVVRIEPTEAEPQVQPLQLFSPTTRRVVMGGVVLMMLWMVMTVIRRRINRT